MRAFLLSMRATTAFFVLPLCTAMSIAAWAAGCSDEDPVTPTPDAGDSGPDVFVPTDAGTDTNKPKRDCTGDLEADGIWQHLECSGLYESFADKKVATDAKPYKPGVEFWSDGAEKARFVFIPPDAKIDTTIFDNWVYPPGIKLWKEFKLGGRRIETRLFMKLADGTWVHTVYRWNEDESDAVRKDTGEKIPGLGSGGATYEIPNTGQCGDCHDGRPDRVLGFDGVSLGLTTATGQTLATLATEGRLSAAPPKTSLAFPTGVTNGDNKAAAAVGWLHANCGACHNPNGGAASRAHFLVRASQLAPADGGVPATVQELDVYTQGYCKPTGRIEDAGAPDASPYLYIRGGSPSRSLMSILSGQRAPEGQEPSNQLQMPPLVSRAVDTAGHQLLDDWIALLPPCP